MENSRCSGKGNKNKRNGVRGKGRILRSGVNWTHFMKIIFVELSYEGSKI
jgi:hypothetical protein